MKAWKTFWIGVAVCAVGLVQCAAGGELHRLVTVAIGLFCMVWGWKIGWTRYRGLTALVGHLAITAGCSPCGECGFRTLRTLRCIISS
ncbi:MAG TPA: hypothetical protein PK408_00165 [Treponemataceae bacterium]|nr:hypothetical protein [Treponemataceae bacterium]